VAADAGSLPVARPAALFPAAALGALLALGGFTFVYAGGPAYLSRDPGTCAACHAMRPEVDAWAAGPHRSVACQDCHLPADGLRGLLASLGRGAAHAWTFTFRGPGRIRLSADGGQTVQANCIRCHEAAAEGLDPDRPCFDCHAETRHLR
jgi:cytochrome c nitrite reductase small subunit